jgi:RNA 2',3'-cyclic 3'-phosphodiesterase
LRQRHGTTRAVVPARRLHVTCCDLGDFSAAPPQALVDATKAAVGALARPGFQIVFDRVLRFKGNEALVMRERDGVTALTEFRDAMSQVLVQAGVPVDSGSTLHMTLAYGGSGVSEPLAEPVSWRAQDFVLIHSLIGQGQHRHLARWPLLPRR